MRLIKNKNIIIIANCLLGIYVTIISIVSYFFKWSATILGEQSNVFTLMLVMFLFELASTTTFQLRIWLTSKQKIKLAALIGGCSWLIAGTQGLLLINGSIDPLIEWQSFLVKIPPVFVATLSGILINDYFIKRKKPS